MVKILTAIKEIQVNDVFAREFTVAAGTQISKGFLLKISDPSTASKDTDGTTAKGYACAGISAMEKEAGEDTSTKITVWKQGRFDIKASGSITAGNAVQMVADNYVAAAIVSTTVASNLIMGTAIETAADDEQIEVEVFVR